MAEKFNANCKICGKPYYMCMACESVKNLNPWKIHTDTSEHYKIFQILHGYSTKVYSKEEAKQRLGNVDLSDLRELRENIQNVIKTIMAEENDGSDATAQAKPVRKKRVPKVEDAQENMSEN